MGCWTVSESGGLDRAAAGRFARYREYKDSGVKWLGEIPAHWEVRRADGLFRCEKIQIDPSMIEDDLAFHYSIPSIQETGDGALEPVDSIGSAKLQITGRRLLVSRLNPRKGVVLVATVRAPTTVCSTEFVPLKLRSSSAVLKWAYFVVAAESTRQRLSARVNSATRSHQRVDVADVLKMWHAVPPPSEQQAIASLLDRASARIDALVSKQQELIGLLQEKRFALICHAVTKGLDPDVAMKDSGVEWLGEIPAHWEVGRLRKTVSDCQNGVWGEDPDGANDVACIRVADFDRDNFSVDSSSLTLRCVESRALSTHRLRRGDLLLEKSGGGERQPVGAVVIFADDLPAVCSNFIARMPASDGHSPVFLVYLHAALYSSRINVRSIKQSIGIQNLDSDSYLDELVGLPPLDEQHAIANFLERETAKIDALIAKANDAIAILNEYRTALISAAVTGKIDVRQQVADLPEPIDNGPLSAKRTIQ